MITTPNGLPLLEPLRVIPVIGNPLADLLQPDLTTIVNLGYGNPNFGYSTGPADVQTYFGLFPHVQPGPDRSGSDHRSPAGKPSPSSATSTQKPRRRGQRFPLTGVAGDNRHGRRGRVPARTDVRTGGKPVTRQHHPESIQGAVTNFANGISNTAANLYGALLPTADIVNTVVTVFPAYDVNLFLSGIQQAINGNAAVFSVDCNMHSSLRLLPTRDCSHSQLVSSSK